MILAACGPGSLVRHGRINEDLIAQIRRRLVATRHLEFRQPVPARALGPEELAAAVDAELTRSFPPADREITEAVNVQLGLLPPGTHVEPALRRLLTTQLAAFYDPRTKELAVATWAAHAGGVGLSLYTTLTGRDVVGELVLAHELTHALQDQWWGLSVDPEPLTASHTDRLLARRALLEGDATWASFATVAGGRLDDATRSGVLSQLDHVSGQLAASTGDVPPLFRETLAFQYQAGTVFVDRLLARGGWAAVDRAQADPPSTCEQVLHPERYLATQRDVPVPIEVPTPPVLARAGWTLVLADTFGELIVRVLASRTLPADRAAAVAEGWDGDRLVAFARGKDLLVVWMTAWDTDADAVDFADALPVLIPKAHVERRGRRVLILKGAWPAKLPAEIWAASREAKQAAALGDDRSLARQLRQVRVHREARRPDEPGM